MKCFLLVIGLICLLTACRPELNKLRWENIYDIGLTDKKSGRSASAAIDNSNKEVLSKFGDAFKLSKEIGKPKVNDNDGYYELSIWFVDRSYVAIQIIFTQQEGTVIKNGNNYYRNEELVALTEDLLEREQY